MYFTEMQQLPHLEFVLDKPLLPEFFLLLQQGVDLRCRICCSVAAFLTDELRAGEETIAKIQSIILDGKPVDDIETAIVKDGSVLALSAAMPGLVGATLRRGGAYSSFRNAITYHEKAETCSVKEGYVRIKLFNLLMAEMGPCLLQRGVSLKAEDLLSFMAGLSQDFWKGCIRTELDNRPVDLRKLQDSLTGGDEILLSVSPA
ncbi:MAG: hypothetical protein HZB62_10310 [Nitrospirae bacterium]|nr:hypothetical protein [Nitrospirota bacterium]